MNLTRSLLFLGAALALSACKPAQAPAPAAPAETPAPAAAVVEPAPAPPAVEAELVTSARTTLMPVAESGVGGELVFTRDGDALRVTGTITGLKSGATHALHIHEFGNCTAADASSAGGHFNPGGMPHGSRASGGEHHAGDIPNQVVGADGVALVDQRLESLQIGGGGAFDIIGRGVIVHTDADDYTTQPTGNAGGRIACGVIESGPVATTEVAPAP